MVFRLGFQPARRLRAAKKNKPSAFQNPHTTEITKLLAPRKKQSIAFEYWACSRDHLERPDWSRDILCFFSRAEQLCFEMNAYGRTFHRGKSFEKDMRSLIIDDILSGGGDVSTEYNPGSFRAAIASKYKVSGVTVSNEWKTFCQTGENLPQHTAARGQPKRLEEPELDLVQLLIKCRPSRKKISRHTPRQQL